MEETKTTQDTPVPTTEEVLEVAEEILARYKADFEELAK